MKETILLSVIIPIYNVELYLERCIKSCLANGENYEIILVDDGSPDNCYQICDYFANKYEFVRVVHKENGGLSDARNYGLKIAKGKYIYFLDSDDYLKINGIGDIIKEIEKASNEDIITCSVTYVYPNIKLVKSFTYLDEVTTGVNFLEIQYRKRTMQIPAWQNIYRREFLLANNLFFKKGILHEDVHWTPRVFYKAKNVRTSNVCTYMYEIRENSISTSKDLAKNVFDYKNTILELLEYFKEIKNTPIYRFIKDDLIMGYLSLYARGNLYKKGKPYKLNKAIMLTNLEFPQTLCKSILFCLSPYLFTIVMKKIILK